MSFKKKMLALAAAGALSAVTAMPAMAFENEFHGSYNLKYIIGNYEQGGFGRIDPTALAPNNFSENRKTNNFFDQRARLFYTAKASDDLKLVTGFEIDSVWGDKAQGAMGSVDAGFRNSGGALESDAVNLETKWVYLDFKIPSTPVNVKAGIQAYKDPFKGIFLDGDIAGVNFTAKSGNATAQLAYFRAYDNSFFSTDTGRTRGVDNLQFVVVDGKYAVTKDINVGAAYILANDSRNVTSAANGTTDFSNLNTFGVYGDAKVGPVALSGFVAAQQGYNSNLNVAIPGNLPAYLNGWAFNVAAKMAAGPGTAKTALLMTTGSNDGKNGWQAIQQRGAAPGAQNLSGLTSAGVNDYNESGMMLLNRNTSAELTQNDYSIVYNTGNRNQGVWLWSMGYDATITPKLYANANVGFAWAAKNNQFRPVDQKTGITNGCALMGTEVNIETGYKLYDNLTAKLQAAYVILGDYYTRSILVGTSARTPEDPYTARIALSYNF